ncbi:MAG: acyl carrier protein [Alphaproteobacteria bacterium]
MDTAAAIQGNHPKHAIRAFIVENLFLNTEAEFGDDDSLLEVGALDSTAAMELVAFIEDTFNIKIEDYEITADNLDSINKICTFLESKTA